MPDSPQSSRSQRSVWRRARRRLKRSVLRGNEKWQGGRRRNVSEMKGVVTVAAEASEATGITRSVAADEGAAGDVDAETFDRDICKVYSRSASKHVVAAFNELEIIRNTTNWECMRKPKAPRMSISSTVAPHTLEYETSSRSGHVDLLIASPTPMGAASSRHNARCDMWLSSYAVSARPQYFSWAILERQRRTTSMLNSNLSHHNRHLQHQISVLMPSGRCGGGNDRWT